MIKELFGTSLGVVGFILTCGALIIIFLLLSLLKARRAQSREKLSIEDRFKHDLHAQIRDVVTYFGLDRMSGLLDWHTFTGTWVYEYNRYNRGEVECFWLSNLMADRPSWLLEANMAHSYPVAIVLHTKGVEPKEIHTFFIQRDWRTHIEGPMDKCGHCYLHHASREFVKYIFQEGSSGARIKELLKVLAHLEDPDVLGKRALDRLYRALDSGKLDWITTPSSLVLKASTHSPFGILQFLGHNPSPEEIATHFGFEKSLALPKSEEEATNQTQDSVEKT